MPDVEKCPMFDGSDREKFLSPHYSQFFVECDWKANISRNVRKLKFLWGKRWLFLDKNRFFFRNRYRWQKTLFPKKSLFFTWIGSFREKSEKVQIWIKLSNFTEDSVFFEETLSSFRKYHTQSYRAKIMPVVLFTSLSPRMQAERASGVITHAKFQQQ